MPEILIKVLCFLCGVKLTEANVGDCLENERYGYMCKSCTEDEEDNNAGFD